jgi:magnesium-transporting ATPase (P-type)
MEPVRLQGLTEKEAARLLDAVGPNEAPRGRQRRLFDILAETMREPMFLLLIGAALLYMLVGDLGEGLFLLAGATAAIGLVILQESRSERARGSLRSVTWRSPSPGLSEMTSTGRFPRENSSPAICFWSAKASGSRPTAPLSRATFSMSMNRH